MVSTKCVLIVDDEPNVRLMLRTALESVGYQVRRGRRRTGRPWRSLRDVAVRPGPARPADAQDGRHGDAPPPPRRGDVTPVVILTAHGSIPDAVAAMKLGAIDFLTKPITPEALRDGRRRGHRPPRRSADRAAMPEAAAKPSDHSKQIALRPGPGQASHQSRPVRARPSACSARSSPSIPDRPRPTSSSIACSPSRNAKDAGRSASSAIGSPAAADARQDRRIECSHPRIPLRRTTLMMSLATLALGLAFFGLFFALVAACDHL